MPAWYNFDQFKFKSIQIQIQMAGKWPEPDVPTKWPSKKLTVIEVERVMIPCRSTSSPQAACMVPCRSWSSVLSTIMLLYACHLFCLCLCARGCVASSKACLSLPPSNELPPFELLIAAGHSLSVPFNLGAISLLNRCEVMISSGEQG